MNHIALALLIPVSFAVTYTLLFNQEDTSQVITEADPIVELGQDGKRESPSGSQIDHKLKSAFKRAKEIEEKQASGSRKNNSRAIRQAEIKYSAKQVIVRSGKDPDSYIPIGSNFIGRLLTSIDTRNPNQVIQVELPYGASFQKERRLPKETILFGGVSYSGQGDKVFMTLSRGVTPEGREFNIQAQALSSVDFSPGLIGEHHGNTDGRLAATIGLSMISAGSEVLIEKEALSEASAPTPKSTMKNAAVAGLAKGTEMEAARQAEKIRGQKDYVTVEAGADLIVSLTESFRGEFK